MTAGQTRLPKPLPEGICVLHSLERYLPISQNWIYPQIVGVPRATGHVITEAVEGRGLFPIGDDRLMVLPRRWHRVLLDRRGMGLLRRRVFSRRAAREVRRRRLRVDLVHAHFGTHGWYSLPLARSLNAPLVTSFYGYDAWNLPKVSRRWRNQFADLFEAGSAFLAEGPAMRARLIEIGCPENKVIVSRIGADLAGIPFERKDFSNGLRVLLVGRFTEKKGLPDGLRACLLARSQGARLAVTIVGDAPAGDIPGQRIKADLLSLANDPSLSGAVTFTGFVAPSELGRLFVACNTFLCPSRHASDGDAEGGSPVVLTQAMAAGLLCIGTRHCDIPEVVVDGRTGFLAAEGDIARLAEILATASQGAEGNGAIAAAGRRHVEQTFDTRGQQERLARVYADLTRRDRS